MGHSHITFPFPQQTDLLMGLLFVRWTIVEGEIDYQTIFETCHNHEIGWYAWEWGPAQHASRTRPIHSATRWT